MREGRKREARRGEETSDTTPLKMIRIQASPSDPARQTPASASPAANPEQRLDRHCGSGSLPVVSCVVVCCGRGCEDACGMWCAYMRGVAWFYALRDFVSGDLSCYAS